MYVIIKKYIFFFLLLLTSCQQRENRQVGSFAVDYSIENPFNVLHSETIDDHKYIYSRTGGVVHAADCPCKKLFSIEY